MKKVLIGLLLVGGLYYAFGRKQKTSEEAAIPENIGEKDIFQTYNNQVIADKDGFWILVKDNKLFTPISLETLQAWQNTNPDKPGVVEVASSVWLTYGQTNYGGQF